MFRALFYPSEVKLYKDNVREKFLVCAKTGPEKKDWRIWELVPMVLLVGPLLVDISLTNWVS